LFRYFVDGHCPVADAAINYGGNYAAYEGAGKMRHLAKALLVGALIALAPALVQGTYAQTPAATPQAPAAKKAAPPMAPAAKKDAASAPKAALLDINRASAADLDALPGIGAARSKAIIAGRPYKAKDELTGRKIIPQNVYDSIKDKIVAHQM
jgi:competence protein ComEA